MVWMRRSASILLALFTGTALAAATAAADAPAPRPAGPAPGEVPAETAPARPAPPPSPPLKAVRDIDFSAALAEARKAAAPASASPEKKELLAGLLLLSGRADEARAVLLALQPPRDRPDSAAAMGLAVAALTEQVRAQRERRRGEKFTEEEAAQRLRLGLLCVASRNERAAHEVVAALGPLQGPAENLRLALLGLSAAAADAREEGVRAAEELARRLSGENRLDLRALTLVDSVQAYGVYTERAAGTCRVGEDLRAYCEVLNFACRQLDPAPPAGGAAPELPGTSHLTALDVDLTFLEDVAAAAAERDRPEQSRVVLHSRGYAQVRHRTRSEIHDLHLVIRFQVPRQFAAADGRRCWVKVTVRDMATGQEAVSAPLELKIAGGQ
ncbi:MAG TPA: hypothetical protein PK280_07980 [Planctomycetota bacterium]|nr:hypothetical protein [Planctomycetota bacterium]